MNLVSLCSGYGGLDLAVEAVTGAKTVAYSEVDRAASTVFARHWPDAEPLGDLTTVDWSTVDADIVCAGFPCQDLSYAGKGAGITKDSRSGLWYAIEHALGVLRPRWVVLENVSAIVARRPGLDVVLAGLASLGFDAEWTCVRASDVGAPHRRERWFLVAYAEGGREPFVAARHDGREAMGCTVAGTGGGDRSGHPASGVRVVGRGSGPQREDAPDAPEHGRAEGRAEPDGRRATAGREGAAPDPMRAGTGRDGGGLPREAGEGGRPRVDVRAARDGGPASADADHDGLSGGAQLDREAPRGFDRPSGRHAHRRAVEDARSAHMGEDEPVAWGDYGPAIERWEHVLGRPAPAPTDDRGRLSPRFVEWMMGLPAGWVTDTPGLSRSKQLKCLGNGVVPQQATYALAGLLERAETTEVAA